MARTVILLEEVMDWYEQLDPSTADQVTTAIDLLEERGPQLGRPLVDTLTATNLPNLKELRPGSQGRSEIRILFAFDPEQQAILLTAGNKAGQWKAWYEEHIPLAEQRYAAWLTGQYREEQ